MSRPMWPWPEDSIDEEDPEPLHRRLAPFVLAIALLVSLCACQHVPTPANITDPIVLDWSEKTLPMEDALLWTVEIKKVCKVPFMVLMVHGGTKFVPDATGKTKTEWWSFPDGPRLPMNMNHELQALHNEHMDREIWLLSCNTGGFDLAVDGVHYAKRIVWSRPSAALGPLASFRGNDCVGDVSEFVMRPGRVKLTGEK